MTNHNDEVPPHLQRRFTGVIGAQKANKHITRLEMAAGIYSTTPSIADGGKVISAAELLKKENGDITNTFDLAVQDVYTALLEKQASDPKTNYYESKLEFQSQSELNFSELQFIKSVIAEAMGSQNHKTRDIDEARQLYRATLQVHGIGAQTSKLLVMQTEKDTRAIFAEQHPELVGPTPD